MISSRDLIANKSMYKSKGRKTFKNIHKIISYDGSNEEIPPIIKKKTVNDHSIPILNKLKPNKTKSVISNKFRSII